MGIDETALRTREELYEIVWQTPMSRLAEQFSLSGNGLAKICRRLEVPYPPRGHWAKLAAGKKVLVTPLPPASPGTPDSVRIAPTEPRPSAELPDGVQQTIAAVEQSRDQLRVPDRLVRPHPIIAEWLAEHDRREQAARRERDPWRRKMLQPEPYTAQDRRRHRILNTLFRELERRDCAISSEHQKIFVETSREKVEVQLREKQKQIRRPLTAEEKERESWHRNGYKQELLGTGFLVFEIKEWLDRPLRTTWLETATKPLEGMLPDIVATVLAAGAVLANRRLEREAQQQHWAEEHRRREEEQQRRKLEANRWRRLVEIAKARRDVVAASELLEAMRAALPADDPDVDGKPVGEWMAWAEERLAAADPLSRGVAALFEDVARVTASTYRD